MIKRIFDVIFSMMGLIILSPILLLIALLIKIDSNGPIIFTQDRVGKNNKNFNIYKFRTMREASQTESLLTIGNQDSRITKIGSFLRRYKIDELPQLMNILVGNMSFVGPRPELEYYVNFYKNEDYIIFSVKPGITSLASLEYINEVELLKTAENPEEFFINTIIPNKLEINKKYIDKQNLFLDIKLIMMTIVKILAK